MDRRLRFHRSRDDGGNVDAAGDLHWGDANPLVVAGLILMGLFLGVMAQQLSRRPSVLGWAGGALSVVMFWVLLNLLGRAMP